MNSERTQRLIVSCDGCGAPYPAVRDSDGSSRIIGKDGDACLDCGGSSFSRLSL